MVKCLSGDRLLTSNDENIQIIQSKVAAAAYPKSFDALFKVYRIPLTPFRLRIIVVLATIENSCAHLSTHAAPRLHLFSPPIPENRARPGETAREPARRIT